MKCSKCCAEITEIKNTSCSENPIGECPICGAEICKYCGGELEKECNCGDCEICEFTCNIKCNSCGKCGCSDCV